MFNITKYFKKSKPSNEDPELSFLNQRLIEINRGLSEQNVEIAIPTDETLRQLVENYISVKTLELPQVQLKDEVSLWYPEEHLEIGGVIAYDGDISVLEYNSIDKCKIQPYKIIKSTIIPIGCEEYRENISQGFRSKFSSTLESVLDLKDNKGTIIDWHTHPKGLGDPSNFDIECWTKLQQDNPGSDIYFVIRCPWKDSSNWYHLEKVQEMNK